MGVWRKWIFPIIRIIIFAAIAAALVKLAFFADAAPPEDPTVPTASIVEPHHTVSTGTVNNDVVIQGTVSADPAVPVKATQLGQIHKIVVGQGKSVKKGAEVMVIREEVPRDDGSFWWKYTSVKAPATGILSSVPVIVGQSVSVGEVIGQIAPPSFRVSGSLLPEQQYRLLTQPTEAQVTITGGPAPFTCTGLAMTTALAGSGGEEGGEGGSGTTVSCSVPEDVRVFAGLGAELTLAGGIAENVLVAPMTAVEGVADTGNVYFVLADGSTELRPVVLGLNDGVNVEIKEGLLEGDTILQFIPGAAGGGEGIPGEPMPFPIDGGSSDDCKELPDGGIQCKAIS